MNLVIFYILCAAVILPSHQLEGQDGQPYRLFPVYRIKRGIFKSTPKKSGSQPHHVEGRLDFQQTPSGSSAFINANNNQGTNINTRINYNLNNNANWKTDVSGQYGKQFRLPDSHSSQIGGRLDVQHKPSGSTGFISAGNSKNTVPGLNTGLNYNLHDSQNWKAGLTGQYGNNFGSNGQLESRLDFQHKPSGSTGFFSASNSKGSGTDVKTGVNYLHETQNSNTDISGHYSKHFGGNNIKPDQLGARLDYHHKPSGSTAFVSADHSKSFGTVLNAEANYNLHDSQHSKADLTGHYSKHFGSANLKPDQAGGRLDYLHKPSSSNAHVSVDHSKNYGTDLNAGVKYNLLDSKKWNADVFGNYAKHFGSNDHGSNQLGGRIDYQHKPSGSSLFTSVDNYKGQGTDVSAGGKYNVHDSSNWRTDISGQYSKHFQSHSSQPDQMQGRLDVKHKPSASTGFVSAEYSGGSGIVKAGVKHNTHQNKNWDANLVAEYSRHFGGHDSNGKIGFSLSLEKKN